MNRRLPVAWTAGAVAAVWLFAGAAGAWAGAAEPEDDAAEAATESAAAAEAEEEDADDPNTGAISITFDSSFTTAYLFRGILVARDGLIWQPSLEVGFNAFEAEEGFLQSVDLGMGIWNSFHTDSGGTPGSDGLFETDYYPSLSLTWAGGVTTAVTYYFYTSPNDSFSTAEEIAVDLSWDDSELLGPFAVSPTVSFYFETHNTALASDAFDGRGSAVVLGIEPGYTFNEDGDWSVGLTFPVSLALSMDEYFIGDYRGGTRNDTFGYAALGLHAAVPISCIPPRFGEWSITNGFDLYFLDDVLAEVNENDDVYPVWTSSIGFEY